MLRSQMFIQSFFVLFCFGLVWFLFIDRCSSSCVESSSVTRNK